jgi:hypothetical protein
MKNGSSEALGVLLVAFSLTTGGCERPIIEDLPEGTLVLPDRTVPTPTRLRPPTRNSPELLLTETIRLEKKTSIVEIADKYSFQYSDDPYYPWYRWNGGDKLFEPLAIPAGTVLIIPDPNLEPPRLPEITNTEEWEHGLSVYSTSLSGSSEKRLFNIELAVERLNGVIIEPYELFSIKDLIGPTNLRGGYVMGWGYEDGEEVPMEAGGVCQVSSTLFKPALEAGMLVVERYAHEFYSERYGPWDATISPVLDFTFRNLYDFPVGIISEFDRENELLTIEIRSPRGTSYDKIVVGVLYNQELESGVQETSVQQKVILDDRTRIREYSSFYDSRKN